PRLRDVPLVSVVGDGGVASLLDYERLETAATPAEAGGELLAVVGRSARPSGNWVSAAVPFFADPQVAAVVTPTVAPLNAPLREPHARPQRERRHGAVARSGGCGPPRCRTAGRRRLVVHCGTRARPRVRRRPGGERDPRRCPLPLARGRPARTARSDREPGG